MPNIEYWIQIENHPWDIAPNNIDRMTGQDMLAVTKTGPVIKTLISPETGAARMRTMYKPLSEDALLLRRYTENWAAPDDRKVNPWDLNEPNPTDAGTMGTIPGAVIECQVGDSVTVHFRNRDHRAKKALQTRTHSLHPHGFVFAGMHDGAYPLSPPDPDQPVGGEAALWASLGVSGFKKGDRVPPDATFTYTWNTIGWPATAGVWLYHDHSICDMDNVQLGAIGIVIIHNLDDPDDVIAPPLPGGSAVGSPVQLRGFPFPFEVPALPQDLNDLGHGILDPHHSHPAPGPASEHAPQNPAGGHEDNEDEHGDEPNVALSIRRGELVLELDADFRLFKRLFLPAYRDPPDQAQYLLLFHNLTGAGMCINGRRYLGNTPTVVAGANTQMRFGLVGMGNADGFHTFHLHGHRWVIPGPDGTGSGTIQGSPQIRAVSQFEDTRTLGPANSFAFTINPDSFMRAEPPLGEWHMHCHVLSHMMEGMMGSLLKVAGGALALDLPRGEVCPAEDGAPGGDPGADNVVIRIVDFDFVPKDQMVMAGQTVVWQWAADFHSTTSDTTDPTSGTPLWDSGVHNAPFTFTRTFTSADSGKRFPYHCTEHGAPGSGMSGTIQVM